ncbi:hypothetical protein RhiirA1_485361, partial [Rhizophagus irregularis]
SFSHCSNLTTGTPSPRLSPLFLPVNESTELGRNLASLVACTIAFLIAALISN